MPPPNVSHAYRNTQEASGWGYSTFRTSRSMKCADSVRAQLLRARTRFGLELKSNDFHAKDYYANIRKCLLSSHLNYGDRFNLLNFLPMTRRAPVLALALMLAARPLRHQSARDHIPPAPP